MAVLRRAGRQRAGEVVAVGAVVEVALVIYAGVVQRRHEAGELVVLKCQIQI